MSKEALVSAVKRIVSLARAGQQEEAYEGYRALFGSPEFAACGPEDRRQALRLMVLSKTAPDPERASPTVVEAHRAAKAALVPMVADYQEPEDYEMLGVCHVMLGETDDAGRVFREALVLERARNSGSDLCGSLMKRVSLL